MANTDQTVDETQAATPKETRADLFKNITRPGGAISAGFVQQRGGARAPGALSCFVVERRLFALQLYLLLHCLALGDPWDKVLPAGAWARALSKDSIGSEATVSRNWHWLKDRGLVAAQRKGRLLEVRLLSETHPGERRPRPTKPFFALPNAFFLDEIFERLSLAGTSALLIALNAQSNRARFQLPKERAPDWFNISADTLQRGFDELRREGFLHSKLVPKKTPRSRTGLSMVSSYRLLGPFEPSAPDEKRQ
jgi:hypothetical protein